MQLKKPKFWDYKKPNLLSWLLWPFSKIIEKYTNIIKKKKINRSIVKTICVGNIYIGGTGKTSFAVTISNILKENNIKHCFIKKLYSDQYDEQKILQNYGKLFLSKE